ncbi:MAG TPA: hypothetical protein VIB79_18250 [Candidatus Binatia bacterium]|jgi:hypothetical protein
MILHKVWKLFLLTVLAVQLGCSTHAPQPPAAPEPAPPAESAQPSTGEDVATEPAPPETMEEAKLPQPPKPSLPESVVTKPETELASLAVKYDTTLMSRAVEPPLKEGWQYRVDRKGRIVGFEFSNHGGNPVLPERYDIEKNRLFTRDFQFHFEDRARQNIHTFVTDWAAGRDKQFHLSELMNTVLLVFPRSYLPAISANGDHYVVTLATGEEVEFDSSTREIRGGVLSEGPVDLRADKIARRYPEINYTGKGVLIRANARGSDPRIGTTATITTGSPPPGCDRGTGCDRCTVPAKELWNQRGSVAFKFPTDAELDGYLRAHCGFGVPKTGVNFALTAPEQNVSH